MAKQKSKPKTWDSVVSWAGMLTDEEKGIIRNVLDKAKERNIPICPYLDKIIVDGKLEWTYCGKRHKAFETAGLRESDLPSPEDPRYITKVGSESIQLFCIGNKQNCVTYRNHSC